MVKFSWHFKTKSVGSYQLKISGSIKNVQFSLWKARFPDVHLYFYEVSIFSAFFNILSLIGM